MDVKFQNSLCMCVPTKIEGYGKYIWTNGSCNRLQNIPKLPDELFSMISAKKSPMARPQTTATTATESTETPTANKEQLDDFRALCSCLSVSQLDNYETWIKIGMILKASGPL